MLTPLSQAAPPRAAAPHCSSACGSARLRVAASPPCAVAPAFRQALLHRRRRTLASFPHAAASADGGTDAQHDVLDAPVVNLVVVGSGPAGYTAAIYAGRANLRPLVFEGLQKGGVPGGQLMTTTEVENYPGFPEGITGPDLMDRMRKQSERWGASLLTEDVEELDLSRRPFRVRSTERTLYAHAVIVATGATAKRLQLPREHEFWSRGISACAICDGASPIFRGAEVAVVGGGDSAAEEAVYLTKYARHVHLLVRGSRMRASAAMADRVLANPRVTVHFKSQPVDVFGDVKGRLAGVRLRNGDTGEERELPVRGVFYAVGHKPNSDLLAGQVELDSQGYVVVRHGAATSVEGVFAAGDLHDTEWRQAITAAGSGCSAAISAERYLAANELIVEPPAATASMRAGEAAVPLQPASPQKEAAAAAVSAVAAFDASQTTHRGQFALRKLYHDSPRPLMVMYTAPTCGPCRRLKPILAKLVEEYGEGVHYVEIDIEEDPEIAQAAGITGTPCVHVFYRKERLAVLAGVKTRSDYRSVIDGALTGALTHV